MTTPLLMDNKLAEYKSSQQQVHVYLLNGIRIVGHIREFDKDTIEVTSKAHQSADIQGTLINRINFTTVQPPSESERNSRR